MRKQAGTYGKGGRKPGQPAKMSSYAKKPKKAVAKMSSYVGTVSVPAKKTGGMGKKRKK